MTSSRRRWVRVQPKFATDAEEKLYGSRMARRRRRREPTRPARTTLAERPYSYGYLRLWRDFISAPWQGVHRLGSARGRAGFRPRIVSGFGHASCKPTPDYRFSINGEPAGIGVATWSPPLPTNAISFHARERCGSHVYRIHVAGGWNARCGGCASRTSASSSVGLSAAKPVHWQSWVSCIQPTVQLQHDERAGRRELHQLRHAARR
jgi:hypothetical protein